VCCAKRHVRGTDGWNQLLNDRLVHIGREIQRLDLGQERGEEKGQSGEQLGGQTVASQ
jgi:hypothetical protein